MSASPEHSALPPGAAPPDHGFPGDVPSDGDDEFLIPGDDPGGDPAWLADSAVQAWLDATADDPPDAVLLSPGAAFTLGGTADSLRPGPVLADLAGRVHGDGLGGLDDDALTGAAGGEPAGVLDRRDPARRGIPARGAAEGGGAFEWGLAAV